MNLRYLSINQMSEMFGIDRRTLKKRLANLEIHKTDGRAQLFDMARVLSVLSSTAKSENQLDLSLKEEELRIAEAKREKLEIEVAQLRGSVVPVEEVGKVVDKEYSYVRSNLLSLPTKLAKPLSLTDDPNEVKERLEEALAECLAELTADADYERARLDIESAREATDTESSRTAEAADEDEPRRMGGRA